MPNEPNILMFHVDNISVGDFGCYGGAYPIGAKTPNIDRFASESLQLTNYNVEAQCTPSRSAFITGRHPVRTGCITALPGSGLVAWEVTIADKLKELGYSNACYGKWHCGEDVGRLPTDKGFDYWYGPPGTWDVALWPEDKWFNKENFEPEHIVESKGKGDLRNIKVLDAEVRRNIDLEFLEKAVRWMEDSKAKNQPFFIYFNHSNVHTPVLPRAEYRDSSNGGAVADCIQMVDGDFKVLLDKLDALGLRERLQGVTDPENSRVAISRAFDAMKAYRGPYRENAPDVIVGFGEGYRASWDSAQGRVTSAVFDINSKAWSGDHCIDPALVPGILFSNWKISGEQHAITDIAPTLLSAFGLKVPLHMDGKTWAMTPSASVPAL